MRANVAIRVSYSCTQTTCPIEAGAGPAGAFAYPTGCTYGAGPAGLVATPRGARTEYVFTDSRKSAMLCRPIACRPYLQRDTNKHTHKQTNRQ